MADVLEEDGGDADGEGANASLTTISTGLEVGVVGGFIDDSDVDADVGKGGDGEGERDRDGDEDGDWSGKEARVGADDEGFDDNAA